MATRWFGTSPPAAAKDHADYGLFVEKYRTSRKLATAMPKPLERSLLTSTISKLNALRYRDNTLAFRKRHGSSLGLAGDPDLYGSWNGLHWELELKAPGEEPTPLQRARHLEWSRTGSVVGVADSPGTVNAFLNDLGDRARSRFNPRAPGTRPEDSTRKVTRKD